MKHGGLWTTKKWSETVYDIREEMRKWGIPLEHLWVPNYNDTLKTGAVTIKYVPRGRTEWQPITCAKFDRPEQNIRAIYQAIENARLMDQRGIASVLAQVTSHLLLPAPAAYRTPQQVLGITPDMGPKQMIEQFRKRQMETHPDQGGDQKEFEAVRSAGEELKLV